MIVHGFPYKIRRQGNTLQLWSLPRGARIASEPAVHKHTIFAKTILPAFKVPSLSVKELPLNRSIDHNR